MASIGMGREPVPRVCGLEAAKLLPSVGLSGRAHLPTTMRATAPGPMPKECHDAFLPTAAPILLRHRPARQIHVPVHPRPRRRRCFHQNLPAQADAFRQAIAPFRDGLVVAAECMFAWYWVADLCAAEGIPFVLGHALYMKAIHGGKAKNDRIGKNKGDASDASHFPAE